MLPSLRQLDPGSFPPRAPPHSQGVRAAFLELFPSLPCVNTGGQLAPGSSRFEAAGRAHISLAAGGLGTASFARCHGHEQEPTAAVDMEVAIRPARFALLVLQHSLLHFSSLS